MSRPKRGFTPESARLVKRGMAQFKDPTVKTSDKVLLAIGILYFLSPIDFIPDIVPFIGYGDDLVITGGTVLTALISIVARAMARKVQRSMENRQPRPPLR